ncbi:MAG: class I SAM-dependent methyltransferase [Acidobacteriota bacterium]
MPLDPSEVQARLEEEIQTYRDVENVHDLPEIFHLWSNRYVLPKLWDCGFLTLDDFYLHYLAEACHGSPGRATIVSVGSGNGDLEVGLAKRLLERGVRNFHFRCLELNPAMNARGQKAAERAGVAEFCSFEEVNLEDWRPDRRASVCLANHSLHHLVGLEALFEKIHGALEEDGVFLINDMIGRNGHMRWPEASLHVEKIWAEMPRRYKYNHQLARWDDDFVNWDCSSSGHEGIRAQDILPLLMETFHFDCFIAFANVIDVFVDRSYGHNFDPQDPNDLAFIERIARLDETLLDKGEVKPTHLFAAARTKPVDKLRCFSHWTPEHCLRVPGGEGS